MSAETSRVGVLLVNLGTPDAPTPAAVRRYLREFLGDPRVIDLPAPLRALLLYGVILPTRPRRSAKAYREIWTEAGSPQLVHMRALRDAVAAALGTDFAVEVGMRYGAPSLQTGLERLRDAGVARIVAAPLFPQYAESTTGSTLARLRVLVSAGSGLPPIATLRPFHAHPAYVGALAAVTRAELEASGVDHVLMSFHGLPERQVKRADPGGDHCLVRPDCCEALGDRNADCYRAQCFATAQDLARALELDRCDYTVAFQSRLGRAAWIQPYTTECMDALADRGVRRLAVISPAFVSDCLETLEELGLRAAEHWRAAGGEAFHLVPCLNAHPAWVEGLAGLLREPEATQPLLDPR